MWEESGLITDLIDGRAMESPKRRAQARHGKRPGFNNLRLSYRQRDNP